MRMEKIQIRDKTFRIRNTAQEDGNSFKKKSHENPGSQKEGLAKTWTVGLQNKKSKET